MAAYHSVNTMLLYGHAFVRTVCCVKYMHASNMQVNFLGIFLGIYL